MGLSRRGLLTALVNGGVGLLAGGFTYGAAHERHRLELTTTELAISGLDRAHDGLRIAFLTDIHHSALVPAGDVERAVRLALAATATSSCSAVTTSPSATGGSSSRWRSCCGRWTRRTASSP